MQARAGEEGMLHSRKPKKSEIMRQSKKIQMRGEMRKYEGMKRTYWYAAMTEEAAQRRRWTFYEVVNSQ